jgi:hypothetical protein
LLIHRDGRWHLSDQVAGEDIAGGAAVVFDEAVQSFEQST